MEGEKPYTLASSLAWLLNYLKKEERNKQSIEYSQTVEGFPRKSPVQLEHGSSRPARRQTRTCRLPAASPVSRVTMYHLLDFS
jgi:hypothetical protein